MKNLVKSKALRITLYILLVIVLLIGCVFLYNMLETNSAKKKPLRLPEGFTVTAHTGVDDTEMNSLASLEAQIASGAQIVEIDVRFRADGTPALGHEKLTESNPGVLLAEALEFVSRSSNQVQINLDLKETANLGSVEGLAKQYNMLSRVFFTGVTRDMVATVQTNAPEIPYYLNCFPNFLRLSSEEYMQELADEVKELGALGINCNAMFVSKTAIHVMHQNDLLVSVWGVERRDTMTRFIAARPDNITTRSPVELQNLIAEWESD